MRIFTSSRNSLASRSLWVAVLALSLAVGGTSCSDDEEGGGAAKPPAAAKKNDAPKKDDKAAKGDGDGSDSEDERLAYSYNPIGKRDPFRSFIEKESTGPEKPAPETPLQKYEIDQYKLVGVIWGVSNPVAMVEDPEGMGYFLTKDTLIGRNWGKVVRITPSEVIVAEEYRDFEGKLIVNEIPLKMPVDKDSK